jgi:HTH-type transcriptional regulator/antitoxin MqsA
MKCPNCGRADLLRDKRDMTFTYKGETTIFPCISGNYCHACGEDVFDA